MTSAATPPVPARPEPPGVFASALLLARPGLRHFLRVRQLLGVAAVAAFATTLSYFVAVASPDLANSDFQHLQIALVAQVVVPLLSLLIGAGAVASERESGTLPYLFTRPVPRASVGLGKTAAAAVLAMAAAVVTDTLVFTFSGSHRPQDLLAGLPIVALEAAALTCAFAFLGAAFTRGFFIALGYLVVWEGAVGLALARDAYSVTAHARNLMRRAAGSFVYESEGPFAVVNLTVAQSYTALVVVVAGALAATAVLLSFREYGLRDRPKED